MLILETPFWVAGVVESMKICKIVIGASNQSGQVPASDEGAAFSSYTVGIEGDMSPNDSAMARCRTCTGGRRKCFAVAQ